MFSLLNLGFSIFLSVSLWLIVPNLSWYTNRANLLKEYEILDANSIVEKDKAKWPSIGTTPFEKPAVALFGGISNGLASAKLLEKVQSIFNGVDQKTVFQLNPIEVEGHFCRVGLTLRGQTDLLELSRFLGEIKNSKPNIWVDRIAIDSEVTSSPSAESKVQVSAQIYGFQHCLSS